MKDSGSKETRCWCPFCGNDKGRPTASLNEQLGLFHCFRCGEGHNRLSLFAKVAGIDNKSAYRELTTLDYAA